MDGRRRMASMKNSPPGGSQLWTVVLTSASFASAMTSKYCVNHRVETSASLECESLYSSATESEKVRGSKKC